jgi:hypothetical protein
MVKREDSSTVEEEKREDSSTVEEEEYVNTTSDEEDQTVYDYQELNRRFEDANKPERVYSRRRKNARFGNIL